MLEFIALAGRLKHVLRASRTGERRENAAEHAWHVALIAVLYDRAMAEGLLLP